MSATTSTAPATGPQTAPAAVTTPTLPSSRPRGWAAAGVAAGVLGIAGIQLSSLVTPVYDPATAGDASAITEAMGDLVPVLLGFHLTTMLLVALLPVVAAGVHRRLRASLPADSLLPSVAASGLLLVAVAALMGTALDTEFIFAVTDPSRVVPESVAFYAHWIGTVNWLWVGAGLTGTSLAVASFRHRAVPRWIGVVGLVLGGLTLLLGISPLQYMAGFVGPVWLLVTALGFAFGDRAADLSTPAR